MRKISGCFVVVLVCILCLCVNVNANNDFYKIKRGKSIKIEKLIGKEKVKSVDIKGLHHIKYKNKRIYALHKGRASIFINNKKYIIEVVGRRDVKHKNRVFIQSGGRYNSKLKYIKSGKSSNKSVAVFKDGKIIAKNKGNCIVSIKTRNVIYKYPVYVYPKSKGIDVSINKYKDRDKVYWLSHIKIKSASQIKYGLANNKPYGMRETTSNFARRVNAVLAVNASFFGIDGCNYYDNSNGWAGHYKSGIMLLNGKSIGKGSISTGDEMCICSDGRICSIVKGKSVKDLLNGNIISTIRGGETLISNKSKLYVNSSRKYNVVAIGMVKPLEYYILVAGSYRDERDTNKGITLNEARDILYSKGCIYAKDLDGGGSSTLVYNGKVVNDLVDYIERPVCDFIYFVN